MLELVNNPTPDQEALFNNFKDKWKEYGLCTKPMDKVKAREAVMLCYDNAEGGGLPRPEHILFVESPFQLYYAKPIWNRICDLIPQFKGGDYLYDPVAWYTLKTDKPMRLRAIDHIFDEIMRQVDPNLDFGGDVDKFKSFFGWVQQLWLKENPVEQLAKEAEKELGTEIYGQHETWLSYYEWQESIGAKGCEETYGLQKLAKSAGWWIPYDVVAVVADRPVEIHVDEEGRLHSHTRPAVLYRDGWSYCASHGMKIPEWLIYEPYKLNVQAIDNESNIEIRRVMFDIYGMENYLEDADAELLDKDDNPEVGELYKVVQQDEDMLLLKVLNSTPENDGTRKVYVLRVPPEMKKAREARAWTFGFSSEEFNPVVET